jgi:SulP family sulfate permease
MPSLPDVDIAKIMAVLPTAFAFALLGSIESLLSAVVADGMTGRRHRSNIELVAQGAANIASGLFGGICVTGTIARTATNIRAGAHGPIAGILHAVFILIFILVAAPLASFIPLASLGGVLAIVAWNMIEKQAFTTLIRASRGDAAVLLSTFLLTIFRDLTEAIIVGFSLGSVLFIHRMSKVTAIETHAPFVVEDKSNNTIKNRIPYDRASVNNREILIYRISGAFFFGAAPSIGSVLDQIADTHRALIIDFTGVPFIDSTAANTIESLAHKAKRKNVEIYLTGTKHHNVGSELFSNGIKSPLVHYAKNIDEALTKLKKKPVDGV